MRRLTRGLALLALGFVLCTGGCTIGRVRMGLPLQGDPSTLVAGESKKADVLELLGPPDGVQHQSDGDAFV